MISIDMEKAKEIHRNRIRKARKLKFEELDVEFQRELEKGTNSNIKPIVETKQQLRNSPADPMIELAKTPEALKAAWNENLLGPSPYQTT